MSNQNILEKQLHENVVTKKFLTDQPDNSIGHFMVRLLIHTVYIKLACCLFIMGVIIIYIYVQKDFFCGTFL